jgi:DNA polymerase
MKPWTEEWKKEKLEELEREWTHCDKCNLLQDRKHVVFGEGNPFADVMFIGEAPGEEEDDNGQPFVGRSGKLLNVLLDAVDVRRDSVYITNVIMCRPPDNREPTTAERVNCSTRLQEEIYLVDPLIIVPVGKQAAETVMGSREAISKIRGKPGTVTIPGRAMPVTYDAIPIFHPAYLLRVDEPRNGKWKEGGETDTTIEDLRMIFRAVELIKQKYRR